MLANSMTAKSSPALGGRPPVSGASGFTCTALSPLLSWPRGRLDSGCEADGVGGCWLGVQITLYSTFTGRKFGLGHSGPPAVASGSADNCLG